MKIFVIIFVGVLIRLIVGIALPWGRWARSFTMATIPGADSMAVVENLARWNMGIDIYEAHHDVHIHPLYLLIWKSTTTLCSIFNINTQSRHAEYVLWLILHTIVDAAIGLCLACLARRLTPRFLWLRAERLAFLTCQNRIKIQSTTPEEMLNTDVWMAQLAAATWLLNPFSIVSTLSVSLSHLAFVPALIGFLCAMSGRPVLSALSCSLAVSLRASFWPCLLASLFAVAKFPYVRGWIDHVSTQRPSSMDNQQVEASPKQSSSSESLTVFTASQKSFIHSKTNLYRALIYVICFAGGMFGLWMISLPFLLGPNTLCQSNVLSCISHNMLWHKGVTRYLKNILFYSHMMKDATPNPGLVWYTLQDMFPRFLPHFKLFHQWHAFAYVIPLVLHFRKSPAILFASLFGVYTLFQPHPVFGDYGAVMCLWIVHYEIVQQSRLSSFWGTLMIVTLILSMVAQWLWLSSLGGNPNFVYTQTYLFSLAFGSILVDTISMALRLQHAEAHAIDAVEKATNDNYNSNKEPKANSTKSTTENDDTLAASK